MTGLSDSLPSSPSLADRGMMLSSSQTLAINNVRCIMPLVESCPARDIHMCQYRAIRLVRIYRSSRDFAAVA